MVISQWKYEHRLRALMRLWSLCFAGMAIVLQFFPTQLIAAVNAAGDFVHWQGPHLAPPPNAFFSGLAVSLLVVLAVLAHNACVDLRRRLSAVRTILLSKVVSTACYALALWTDTFAFGYLVGVIADGGIALWTFAYYRHVRHAI
jgi:Na+-transporting methylmalonyl-CoA/oxaloacetate decarboxylase gamma subunit